MKKFVIIRVPQFLGQPAPYRVETEQLHAAGLMQDVDAQWVDIEPDYESYPNPVIAVNVALAGAIHAHADKFPVVLASDCVSSLGMVKGLSFDHQAMGIVWYDAHGDFNTPETTPSGFLGGMPLAVLVGRGNQDLMEGIGLSPMPESHIIFTDGRDLDPQEGENLRASGITFYEDVQALMNAPLPSHPVYIHLDVDILDPRHMPALGYPAPNGPSPADVIPTLERLANHGNVVGLLVSLWNADKADDMLPLDNTLKMIHTVISHIQ